MTLTLRQHFPSLPEGKEKEIYRRREGERRKLPDFCQFALKFLKALAKRERGSSVLTERGDRWCAARKAGHNNFHRVVVLLSPHPPLLVSLASPPPQTILPALSHSQCKHVLIFTLLKWDSVCPSSYSFSHHLLSLLPFISELTTYIQWAWSLSSVPSHLYIPIWLSCLLLLQYISYDCSQATCWATSSTFPSPNFFMKDK